MRNSLPIILVCCIGLCGCGTTKWSDTKRTATEQLLISDAMDQAVSRLDFRALAGKKTFLESTPLKGTTDSAYLVSAIRQHMLAGGCLLMDKRDDADYVVEVRSGAVGTDRREVLFGVPATKIPGEIMLPGVPSSIPEMALAKKTEQSAVTKIAVFAYNRETGRPVWQSGARPIASKAKDLWVLGAGPFQRGNIYEGTNFAGDKLSIPLVDLDDKEQHDSKMGVVSVTDEAYFAEPIELLAKDEKTAKDKTAKDEAGKKDVQKLAEKKPATKASPAKSAVVPASHTEAAKDNGHVADPDGQPPKYISEGEGQAGGSDDSSPALLTPPLHPDLGPSSGVLLRPVDDLW